MYSSHKSVLSWDCNPTIVGVSTSILCMELSCTGYPLWTAVDLYQLILIDDWNLLRVRDIPEVFCRRSLPEYLSRISLSSKAGKHPIQIGLEAEKIHQYGQKNDYYLTLHWRIHDWNSPGCSRWKLQDDTQETEMWENYFLRAYQDENFFSRGLFNN